MLSAHNHPRNLGFGYHDDHVSSQLHSHSHKDSYQSYSYHQRANSLLLILLIIDGIGLAIIAGCTIAEAKDLWNDFFNEYYESNLPSLSFWFAGKICQVTGLLALISYAALFQTFPELESAGMMMLTAGPVLNLLSYSYFYTEVDPLFLFNKRTTCSEILELIGISVLDLSMMDTKEHYVLLAEVLGFTILAFAAVLDFDFISTETYPNIVYRLDLIHLSDCFGLGLLTVVAIGQYRIKVHHESVAHESSLPKYISNNNSSQYHQDEHLL